MQKLKLVGLAILSGLLMGVSWPATGNIAPLFFISLLPLLYVEYTVTQNKLSSGFLYLAAFICFLTFNGYTTWWIYYASGAGMIMAVVLNSIFMGIVFLWFHKVKTLFGNQKGYLSLIFFWVTFEWWHYHWEFSHPWSSFGNVFAEFPQLIQWYEYTGVLGGTIWLLSANILIFNLFRRLYILRESVKQNLKQLILVIGIIAIPMIISTIQYTTYEEIEAPANIVVVQPNIDPYNDKFGGMTVGEQVERILSLAREKTTENTQYVVAPETAIPRGSLENELEDNYAIQQIRGFLEQYPKVKFIIGASTYLNYEVGGDKPTPSARQNKQTQQWYDAFNSALMIAPNQPIQIYHKSKLVLGVERLPFAKLLAPLEDLAINLGGTFGSLGIEKEAKNLDTAGIGIAPVICYESIYGDYVGDYIAKGAQLIFVITNDGWWEDTPGYKQHLAYARLRAIETRRSIVRSANTGISCFINQRGDVFQKTDWWVPTVISGSINANSNETFYTAHGDFFGRLFAGISILLILWYWTLKIKRKIGSTS